MTVRKIIGISINFSAIAQYSIRLYSACIISILHDSIVLEIFYLKQSGSKLFQSATNSVFLPLYLQYFSAVRTFNLHACLINIVLLTLTIISQVI